MEHKIYGQILETLYEIDWSTDASFEDRLLNPTNYIKEVQEIWEYVELTDTNITRGKCKSKVLDTLVDVDKRVIHLYTDYIVGTFDGKEEDRQERISSLISICERAVQNKKEWQEASMTESKKWYQFWK